MDYPICCLLAHECSDFPYSCWDCVEEAQKELDVIREEDYILGKGE
jgi:hypothetical protein